MSILHTAKWCQDRQKYSTHAGHDHSKNISSLKELRNNVGKSWIVCLLRSKYAKQLNYSKFNAGYHVSIYLQEDLKRD